MHVCTVHTIFQRFTLQITKAVYLWPRLSSKLFSTTDSKMIDLKPILHTYLKLAVVWTLKS